MHNTYVGQQSNFININIKQRYSFGGATYWYRSGFGKYKRWAVRKEKFRKSKILNFADLNNLLDVWIFANMLFVICGLKTSANAQVHTFSPYKCSM
jgi:hypothetical protein